MNAAETFKATDVEEWIDLYLHRPLASLLVKVLAGTPITPNQVTILSGLVGLSGGLIVGFAPVGQHWLIYLAASLLFAAILLDCCDGQLARLRGISSMVGRALDGMVDVIPVAAVFFGFAFYLMRAGYDPWLVWTLGWTAGFSMRWHVHSYDHAKNIYLHNTRTVDNAGGAVLAQLEAIKQERDQMKADGKPVSAFLLTAFYHLTKDQQRSQQHRLGLGQQGMQTTHERNVYRTIYLGHMRAWSFNGLGTHLFLFIVAMLVTPFYDAAILVYWALLIVPFNVLTLYLRLREKPLDAKVMTTLDGH